jgi:hypothetical protein
LTPRIPHIFALVFAAGVAVSGCYRPSLVPFSLDTPPLILTPASLAGVRDGRGRFREIFCAIRADHGQSLPDDRPCEAALVPLAGEPKGTGQPVNLGGPRRALRIAVVPGFLNDCFLWLVSPLSDGLAHLRQHGYRTEMIHVSGLSGSAHNAREIRDALIAMALEPGERVVLVGYSKGTSDSLEALVAYPEILPHVAALVSVAGVVAGSPIADSVPDVYLPLAVRLGLPTCRPHDLEAVESLRRSTRLTALARAPLPAAVRYFSVGGIVTADEASELLRLSHRELAQIDGRNDGLVIFSDTVIPGGTLLGFVRADHLAIAMPIARLPVVPVQLLMHHNAFPREVMLEAIVRAVEEAL